MSNSLSLNRRRPGLIEQDASSWSNSRLAERGRHYSCRNLGGQQKSSVTAPASVCITRAGTKADFSPPISVAVSKKEKFPISGFISSFRSHNFDFGKHRIERTNKPVVHFDFID